MGEINWIMMASVVIAFFVAVVLAYCISLYRSKGVHLPTCTIRINNDPELTKTAEAGETLLRALAKGGIAVPSPCRGHGLCRQCRLQIIEHAPSPQKVDIKTFTGDQIESGWRLSCQVCLHHDLGVKIPENLINVKEIEATVVTNRNISTFIKELVVLLPQGQKMEYKPGSYVRIFIPPYVANTADWKESIDQRFVGEWEKHGLFGRKIEFSTHAVDSRTYSLASYPAEGERVIFNVRIATPPFEGEKVSETIPWGFGSSYLFSLKTGENIRLAGPYGKSFMKGGHQDVYFLIGGVGSSFGRSHIFDLVHTKRTSRKVSLWYGARSLRENMYQHEYEEMEKTCPQFSYHLVLSEPTKEDIDSGWPVNDPVKTAFLYKAFEQGVLKAMRSPEKSLYYVCGPPMHNRSVMKLLDDYGVPKENIVLDDFGI